MALNVAGSRLCVLRYYLWELFLTIDFDELVDQTEDHPLRKEIEIYGYEYYLEMLRECA